MVSVMNELFTNADGGGNNTPPTRSRRKKTKSVKALGIPNESVEAVWQHWKTVMQSDRAVLDDKRKLDIAAAIHDYGIEGCTKAIDGCVSSAWHMGANPQRKKYNGISLIFRDAEKTEGFMQRASKPDARKDFLND